MTNTREMILGVPGDSADLYLRHQQVWQGMHGLVREKDGAAFQFAQIHSRLYQVRSTLLPVRGTTQVRLPTSGQRHRFHIDLVAMRGQLHNEPISRECVPQWAYDLLGNHGFDCGEMSIESLSQRSGKKKDMKIVLQVAKVTGQLTVIDSKAAQHAFMSGIGRGKRFGFGMLRLS